MSDYTTDKAICKHCLHEAQEHKNDTGILRCPSPMTHLTFEFKHREDQISNYAEGVLNRMINFNQVPADMQDEVKVLCKQYFEQPLVMGPMKIFVYKDGEMIEQRFFGGVLHRQIKTPLPDSQLNRPIVAMIGATPVVTEVRDVDGKVEYKYGSQWLPVTDAITFWIKT